MYFDSAVVPVINETFDYLRDALSSYGYEFNDNVTRYGLTQDLQKFLRLYQVTGRLIGASVYCTEQNNPPLVRDLNDLIADVKLEFASATYFIRGSLNHGVTLDHPPFEMGSRAALLFKLFWPT